MLVRPPVYRGAHTEREGIALNPVFLGAGSIPFRLLYSRSEWRLHLIHCTITRCEYKYNAQFRLFSSLSLSLFILENK